MGWRAMHRFSADPAWPTCLRNPGHLRMVSTSLPFAPSVQVCAALYYGWIPFPGAAAPTPPGEPVSPPQEYGEFCRKYETNPCSFASLILWRPPGYRRQWINVNQPKSTLITPKMLFSNVKPRMKQIFTDRKIAKRSHALGAPVQGSE